MRLHHLWLHRPVHHADVPVDDPDALAGAAGIFLAPLAHLDPLDEQPQEFRRQFVDGSVPLRLLNEGVHIGCRCLQLLQSSLLLRDSILQSLLIRIVIAGEHPELFGGHPAKDMVLIEPLEQHREFTIPFPHSVQLLLESIHLPPQFYTVFLVDVLRELTLLRSGGVRYPADVVQYDLHQIHLPDVVRGAVALPALAEGVALEIVPGFLHGGSPVQYQRLAAVSAVNQSREHIRLIHLLRSPFLVLTYRLDDVPPLLADQCFMGILHQDLLTLRTKNMLLVLVGDGCVPQPVCMPQVDLAVKDSRNRAAAPVVWPSGIQMPVGCAILLVVVIAWVQDFLLGENTGNLVRPLSGSAQLEDTLHHRGGVLIRNDRFCVAAPLAVAVGRSAAQPLAAFGLELLHRPDFLTGLLGVEFVRPVPNRIES